MLSNLEKSPDLQKATKTFINAVKGMERHLPTNRTQIEGDLCLFIYGL